MKILQDSAFIGEKPHITGWMSADSKRNKNWTIFSTLAAFMAQSAHPTLDTVTLKYFEPGHCRILDARMEAAVRKESNIYDFPQYVDRIRTLWQVSIMTDFLDYKSRESEEFATADGQIAPLADIHIAQFRKGDARLHLKTYDSKDFVCCDFLNKEARREIAQGSYFSLLRRKPSPVVTEEMKRNVLKALLPILPQERREFWENLPTSGIQSPAQHTSNEMGPIYCDKYFFLGLGSI